MPLVSCIMPTANRRRFVPEAIRLFLAQDYPEKELVILDDGEDSVADLMPRDLHVRYVRNDHRRQPLGAKRNAACAEARGDIILHWDDDDWYAPSRIRTQVEALERTQADLCGLDRVYFIDPRNKGAWEYVYPAGAAPWIYGATLCYRKTFWQARPFPEVSVGEDTRFVMAARDARIHALADNRFFIGLVHPANTSPKRVRDARWQPRLFATVRAMAGAGWPREAGDAPPPRPTDARGPALVTAASGIGDIMRVTPLIRALHQLGHAVDVLLAPDCPEAADLLRGAPEVARLFETTDVTNGRAPHAVLELRDKRYEIATFTVWSAPFARQVHAGRQMMFHRAEWLAHGDSACAERIARAVGWDGPLPEPFAMASDHDFGLPAGTVALHPGCKPDWPWKKWHGFDALARRFPHVAVIGTTEDLDNARTYFDRPFAWPENARNYVGQLKLADTAALIRQSAALVANDSGLMHLGVALGVPTFGVFGITSPAREAIPSRRMVPVSKGLQCEPACRKGAWGRRDCNQHLECLKMLTADDVAERINEALPKVPRVSSEQAKTVAHDAIRLNYYGQVSDVSGYGHAARAYVHALHEAGIRLTVVDTGSRSPQVQDPLVVSLLGNDPGADFNLFHGIPPYWARMAYRLPNVIAMTVWETDTMPSVWRNPLTHAIDIWLPCRFNTEVFARGLGREPFCLPHPVPPRSADDSMALDWAAIDIEETDFVFYACFEWQERKNPAGLFETFLKAFADNRDAVLLVKTGASVAGTAKQAMADAVRRWPAKARIVLQAENWAEPQIAAMHARGNCYVSLHKGEGWGYPLFEAACRGTPVVATAYAGPLDYLDPKRHWLVRATQAAVRQPYFFYDPNMRWAEPDLAHAAEGLRWVYEKRGDARSAARSAAEEMQVTYSLRQIGEIAKTRLIDLVARTDRMRAGVLSRQNPADAPPQPIPGAWFDAGYFETGRKSNWDKGYTWPLFCGVFRDAATCLTEVFPEARSFLDVGCAKGFLVRALREHRLEAWGLDHSAWAIDHAEGSVRDFLRLASVESAAYDRSFDVLVAMSILESLTEAQLRAFLPRARAWTRQALFAVIAPPSSTGGDRSQITLRDRAWWRERMHEAGWVQDPLHRRVERLAQAHPVPGRMGWSVHIFSPGHGP
ncbi:MAG: glycosyltransferase [Pseudomonadota bacterium]|nr:glycosyltransferase [Pseudomonadota bacterium]